MRYLKPAIFSGVLLMLLSVAAYVSGVEQPSKKPADTKTSTSKPQTTRSSQTQPQTQTRPQTQPQTRAGNTTDAGDFTIIVMKPGQKNTTTISTPLGLDEQTQQRLEMYKRLKQKYIEEKQKESQAEEQQDQQPPHDQL